MDYDEENRIIQQIRDAHVEGDSQVANHRKQDYDYQSMDIDVIEVDLDEEMFGIGELALDALEEEILKGWDESNVIDVSDESDVIDLEEDEPFGIGKAALAALEIEILNADDENEVIDVSDESGAIVLSEIEVEDSFTSSDFLTEEEEPNTDSYDESAQEDSSIPGQFLTENGAWEGVKDDLLHALFHAILEGDDQAAVLPVTEGFVVQPEADDLGVQFPNENEIEEQMLDVDLEDEPMDVLELWGDQQMEELVDDFQLYGEIFTNGYEFAEQIAEAVMEADPEGEPIPIDVDGYCELSPKASDVDTESELSWLYEIEIEEDVGFDFGIGHRGDSPIVDDNDEEEIDHTK